MTELGERQLANKNSQALDKPQSETATGELSQLSVPKKEAGASLGLPPKLSGSEMRNTLKGYQEAIPEPDKTSYAVPAISAGVLADHSLRHFDAETKVGVSISAAHYSPDRTSDSRGSFLLRDQPEAGNKENKEVKVTVYTRKSQGWGEGEKEFTVFANKEELAGTVQQIERDIKSGEIDKRFTHQYKRNEDTGKLELTPVS